ncbi:MAG: hypothetical protein ACFCVK_24995 [Acidimicrobiales bacterium]
MSGSTTITVPDWAHGRPGVGQGGYSAACFQAAIGRPVVVSFRAPIPLETPLAVSPGEGGWMVTHDGTRIMDAEPLERLVEGFATTDPVPIDVAAAGRAASEATVADGHDARSCFSCGLQDTSMKVHAGPLPDGSGRSGTDWLPPPWVGDDDGVVAAAVVWAVMDCAQGFYVGRRPFPRQAVTGRYAVEMAEPILVGRPYAVVAHDGHWSGGWDGRKRGAAASVFAADGTIVARADSLWIAVG